MFANVFDDAFAHMFQIRQFGALSVQHQGNDISRKAAWRSWFLFDGCDGVRGLTGHAESAEGRVKEFNLLRHTVLGNCEVFRFKIGDRPAFFVFDNYIEAYEVRTDLNYIFISTGGA